MTVTNLVGRTVALTTAACLITAVPAAALPAAAQGGADTTGATATGVSATAEPHGEQRPETSPTSSRHRPAPDESTAAATALDEDEPAAPGEGAIADRYANLPVEVRAQIGEPVAEEVVVGESLRYRDYEHARFYWTPEYGVNILYGAILDKYLALGAHEELGAPGTEELAAEDGVGRYITLPDAEYGKYIIWSEATGAHLVWGTVVNLWRELGGGPVLGYPTTDTRHTPEVWGFYNHFRAADGTEASIYGSGYSGLHAIRGPVRARWAATGWEKGPLGFPTTNTLTTDDGVGLYNRFSGTEDYNATLVWSPDTGAHYVQGVIEERYERLGGPNGDLGFPTTDERSTPDGVGRYNHFTGAGGSSIYWSPRTGAHEIHGSIRDRWQQLGWERSYLGYPTSGEYSVGVGRRNNFQHGTITWNNTTNEVVDRPW